MNSDLFKKLYKSLKSKSNQDIFTFTASTYPEDERPVLAVTTYLDVDDLENDESEVVDDLFTETWVVRFDSVTAQCEIYQPSLDGNLGLMMNATNSLCQDPAWTRWQAGCLNRRYIDRVSFEKDDGRKQDGQALARVLAKHAKNKFWDDLARSLS